MSHDNASHGTTRRHRARAVTPACLVLIGLIGLVSAATGSESETASGWERDRGFEIGLQFMSSLIGAEDPSPGSNTNQLFIDEVGAGLALTIGYAFTPHFALRFGAGGAAHETTQDEVEAYLSSFAFEAHYRFLPRERGRPYLLAGLGGTTLGLSTSQFNAEARGGDAVVGIGLLYSLTRHLVFDFTARLDLINWNEVALTRELQDGGTIELEEPVDDSGSAGKILFGILWQF